MAIESVQYIVELIDKETSLPLHSSPMPMKYLENLRVCQQGGKKAGKKKSTIAIAFQWLLFLMTKLKLITVS